MTLPSLAPLAAAFACVLISACGGSDDEPAPTSPVLVQTQPGTVLGVDDSAASGTYHWLGIPYAEPPLGALRWKAPVDVRAWSGTRNANAFGNSCAQAGRFYSPAPNNAPFGLSVRDSFGKPVGSEDCLTLNVWRPAGSAQGLPVIVFVHGGSNISGYTADPAYDGAALAKRANAVVVTVNYRLGMFGWLNLAQLKTGSDASSDSGNFATLDLLHALKFVKQNIAGFGGDPANVTLTGQSAGAVNVWSLIVSPLSSGLFHKAAPLSGGMLFVPPATAKVYADKLLAAVVIADGLASDAASAATYLATQSNQQLADYLRGKTADQLLQIHIANAATLGLTPAVFLDGTVVPVNPAAAIAADAYLKVPLLVGNTRDEGKLFGPYKPTEHDRFTMQFNFDPDAAPTLTEADLLLASMLPVTTPVTGWNAVSSLTTNGLFVASANAALAAVSARQSNIWVYRFDWDEEPVPFNTVYGAAHAMDLPFVFGTFDRKSIFSFAFSTANRSGRLALSQAMIDSLGAFARGGNPNHAGLGLTWDTWPKRIVFDATPTQLQLAVQ